MPDEVKPKPESAKPAAKSPEDGRAGGDPSAATKPAPRPSAEEQMDAFEDSLKESDWGHQPC